MLPNKGYDNFSPSPLSVNDECLAIANFRKR
jgi:hypothetical protein